MASGDLGATWSKEETLKLIEVWGQETIRSSFHLRADTCLLEASTHRLVCLLGLANNCKRRTERRLSISRSYCTVTLIFVPLREIVLDQKLAACPAKFYPIG